MSAAAQLSLFAPVPRAVARAAFRAVSSRSAPAAAPGNGAPWSLRFRGAPAPAPERMAVRPPLVVVRDDEAAPAAVTARPRPPVPLPAPGPLAPVERLPTGLADLDRFLGGGVPRGEVVEVCGGVSSGKATLALGMAQAVLAAGGRAAWVDPGAGFWPLVPLEAGGPVDRLVVVRTPDDAAACRAADILLGTAGAVDLVVVDLVSRAGPREARVTRLHRLAERGGAVLVFLSGRPEGAASIGALVGLRLVVRRRHDSPVLEVGVARYKRGPGGRTFVAPHHDPDRLRLDSTV